MNTSIMHAIIGRLLTIYGFILMTPVLVAVIYKDSWAAIISFALTGLATTCLGLFLKRKGHIHARMGIREGFGAVAGAWILASAIGALPLYFSGTVELYIDALFETVSGFTTTGASIYNTLEILPKSILFWRSMTHWLGGMGIIVLFIVLLPNLGVGAVQLFNAEVPGPINEKILPKIRDEALVLWLIYSGMTGLQTLLLMIAGMSPFDAINHSLATLATGGFSTRTASITAYNSLPIEIIIICFMALAGVNFNLYIQALRRGGKNVLQDKEFRVYILILLFSSLFIAGNLIAVNNVACGTALRQSIFQVVSVCTTTGFVTADFNQWPGFSKLILFFLMFVGGSAGSTAGGIKVARMILLAKMAWASIKQLIHPQLVINIVVQDKPVDRLTLSGVARFFFLFIFSFVIGTLLLAACGLEPFDAMSAVVATLGNVGPGFGVVGPMSNFSAIPPFGKVVLTVCMLLGRLELFTLLVFLQPEFWRPVKKW